MKKVIIILSIFVLATGLLLTGCKGPLEKFNILEIPSQPEVEIQETSKIYPSQVGNILKDAKVNIPAINQFMANYNSAANEGQKIDYDYIRYNADTGYYYVNDKNTSKGIKFMLDSSGNRVISASVYTGNFNNHSTDLVDMAKIALTELGYKNAMSSEDVSNIQNVLSKYNVNQGNIQAKLPEFQAGMPMTINRDNLFVELALGDMPLSYTQQDVDEANSEKDAYVPSPNLNDPTRSAEQEGQTYDHTMGNEFKDKYGEDIQNNVDKVPSTSEATSTNGQESGLANSLKP